MRFSLRLIRSGASSYLIGLINFGCIGGNSLKRTMIFRMSMRILLPRDLSIPNVLPPFHNEPTESLWHMWQHTAVMRFALETGVGA